MKNNIPAYKCKHFTIKELVPPEVLNELGPIKCWELFDDKALIVLDWFREQIGRQITVNDWSWGGQYKYRGYRPKNCKTGAKNSQHKEGAAFDFSVKGWTDEQTEQWIIEHEKELPFRIRIEDNDDVSKVHFDTKSHGATTNYYFFKP